jgi:hypothetical protein
MTPEQAFNKLVEKPSDFLEKHVIRVQSLATPPQTSYWIYDDGENLGGKQSFRIAAEDPSQPNQFQFTGTALPTQDSDTIDIESIAPTELQLTSTSPLMTVLLTGCSIVMQASASSLLVAHIRPRGIDGDKLQEKLEKKGQFQGTTSRSGLKVYGRENYPQPRRATVIGFLKGDEWKIYAQAIDLENKQPIRRVKRIFHAELS